MDDVLITVILVIALALVFDFTNGFHDTGNAMATSIATGALKPKVAVLLAGVLNLVGAFLSVEVAVTVTTSVLKVQDSKTGHLLPGIDATMGLEIIFAGLIGGILWKLLTWLFGIPSSSSHALFGGLIGAGLAAIGLAGVNWTGVTQKVLIPALAAPLIAGIVAACGTWLVYRITRNVEKKHREEGFRWGQIATASLVALSHGTNDAQKTMGVIALALITTGHLTGDVKANGLPSKSTTEVTSVAHGTVIAESVAICRYLEALQPEPPLFGRDAKEQALVEMWCRRVELVLMAPVGAVWVHTHRFTAALPGRNADWGERAVREAVSLSSTEAADQHVVDLIAGSIPDLLKQVDGRSLRVW